MAVHVFVYDDSVDVTINGLDRWLSLSAGVHLPMDDVLGARVASFEEVRSDIGWRVGGTYWPRSWGGGIATGWYTVPGRKGARQLWCVFTDPEVLVIDTTLERPSRVVLQVPDRHDLAWFIGERLARRRAAT
ncbi:MAG: hypothetical protein R2726_10450 [Acidimicrobiales bacterium]